MTVRTSVLRLGSVLLLMLISMQVATALTFGQLMSGAGAVSNGMQQAENQALQNRLLELQVQEANRLAIIQQLEYQRRMQELDQARQQYLQRQQRENIEALRREQAQIAAIKLVSPAAKTKPSVSDELQKIADRLRQAAPKALATGATLAGASSKGNKLYILVKLDSLDVSNDSYKKVANEILNQESIAAVSTCLDHILEPLTRQGAVIRYSYFDAQHVFIDAIETKKTDCFQFYGQK